MRASFLTAGLAVAMAAASPAFAANAEPDDFAAGTDISNAYAGVTLLTIFTGANVNDVVGTGSVFSVTDPNATTGTQAFGQSASDSTWGNGSFEYLLATFTSPVGSVSLDFFANDSTDSNAQLLAYDQFGALLDTQTAALVTLGSPVTLTVTGTDIKFVRAYWDEINRIENGGLDNLVFGAAAVPEPGTWAMMLLGFGFVGSALRRSRARTAFA